MSSAQNDTYVIGGTQLILSPLGASVFPTPVKSPSIAGGQFRAITTGGSICLMPTAVSGASIGGATAQAYPGWLLGASETIAWVGPASFYLSSLGGTSVVQFLFEYSAGATLA